jgi:glycosyltransferase involved in cell wall biosynthesis
MKTDISVLIPTYNRAQELARTLKGMTDAERGGLSVETIVIDNGSTDETKSVVASFADRLRIRYIFESRPGKSRALNTALEEGVLGNIVAFTDDDVDPSREWLVSIASASERWPQHSVFGGRINIRFPIENVPQWAFDPEISRFAFAYHNYASDERVYRDGWMPFGPNFWLRSELLRNGRRFNEAIGPFATGMILGEDTSFLLGLLHEGNEIVFVPDALVTHRIRAEMLELSILYRRAFRRGRGEAHIYGIRDMELLRRSPTAWFLYRRGSIIRYALETFTSFIFSDSERGPLKVTEKMRALGYRVEAIRIAKEMFKRS